MSMGKNIAVFRKRRGFTQEELGQRLGITNQAISKWESEASLPDVMLLPQIAQVLEVSLDDLYAQQLPPAEQTVSHVLDMDAVHRFAGDAQTRIIDDLCRKTNLVNGNAWDFLRMEQNPATELYDHVKRNHTLCCLSDQRGAAFVSDDLTMIDSGLAPTDIAAVLDNPVTASGLKKLADPAVRRVLSHICGEYFIRSAPFDEQDPEYFVAEIDPKALSHSTGLSADEVLEALEKLIALHLVERSRENGTHYLLHKVKAIETAAVFRLIERLMHNEVGIGCGEFLTMAQY